MGQKFDKNFEFLNISSLYVPYISATAKNRRLAPYVAFWLSLQKPREICAPWKSYLECEWRVCVSSTDALVKVGIGFRFRFSKYRNIVIFQFCHISCFVATCHWIQIAK